jgi:uncharacterized protein
MLVNCLSRSVPASRSIDDFEAAVTGAHLLTTIDGMTLAARSSSPKGPSRGTVVLAHGLSAGKDHPDVVEIGSQLSSMGLAVISYDARGHGESEGTCTLGDLERHDVAAALGLARRSGGPVVLVGASMGGIAVLRHSATDTDLAGVVVVSTPARWRIPPRGRALLTVGLTRTKPGRWVTGRRMGVRLHPVWTAPEPPYSLVGQVSAPLAIVHGARDRMIPRQAALDLYACGGAERRLFLVPDMGHAFHPAGHDAICEAVDWALERAGSVNDRSTTNRATA